MVSPRSNFNQQRVQRDQQRVIVASFGVNVLLTVDEAQRRIQELRSLQLDSQDNNRREILDYLNFQAEADDLEHQISNYQISN
jgi:hypothetical protein